jgi:hypothetical protein
MRYQLQVGREGGREAGGGGQAEKEGGKGGREGREESSLCCPERYSGDNGYRSTGFSPSFHPSFLPPSLPPSLPPYLPLSLRPWPRS